MTGARPAVFAGAMKATLPLPKRRAVSIASQKRERLSRGGDDPVLDDPDERRQALDFRGFIEAMHLAVDPDAQVALLAEEFEKAERIGAGRRGHGEGDEERFARVRSEDIGDDRSGGFRANHALAGWTGGLDDPRQKELQVVIDLRHRADGRAGGFDVIRLLDGDGRRDAADRVHLGLVHAVHELPGVGRKSLDVTALALGVNRIEGEAGFPGTARAGDDDQFAERQIEIEAFEVVFAARRGFRWSRGREQWSGRVDASEMEKVPMVV